MLIPLSTEEGTRKTPVVTLGIVGLTVAAHVILVGLRETDPQAATRMLELGAIQGGVGFHWWALFTSTLLHGGWMHLLGNMVFLWVFGPAVEQRLGRVGFLAFYCAGAAISGGAHALFVSGPAIGASGAIAAVTGAFIAFLPGTRIRCLWLFGLSVVMAPAWWVIGLGIAWNLLASSAGIDEGVAHAAHLAGYAFGIALGITLLGTGLVPRTTADLFTVVRQAQRRHAIRSASAGQTGLTRPEQAAKRKHHEEIDAIAEARAKVSGLLSARNYAEAAEAYRRMARRYSHHRELLTLSRGAQYELATYLHREGLYEEAAEAFGRLIEQYPNDREADQIRLLLARTYARRLQRPTKAAEILEALLASSDDEVRALAEREREKLAASQ